MKFTYVPTEIKQELVRFGMDCDQIVGGGPMAIHSSVQTVFSLSHIEGITLSAGEEVDEVAGGASSMGVDRIGEVGNRASEGQVAGMYEAGFTARSLARKGARSGTRGTGNTVSSDKELMEDGRR